MRYQVADGDGSDEVVSGAGSLAEVDVLCVLELSGALDVVVGGGVEDEAEILDVEVESVVGMLEVLGTLEVLEAWLEEVDAGLVVLDAKLEVLAVPLSNKSPIWERVKPPGTRGSVGQKASGYVVPSTTVPAAARALSYAELMLADALNGHAGTVVVVAVVVISHPVVVLVVVSQLIELLSCAEPVTKVQVTYRSYPVIVLVQELVDEAEESEVAVEVTEVVGSVGELVGYSVG